MTAKADHCEFQNSRSAQAENFSHASTNTTFKNIYYGSRAEILALLKGLKFTT